MRVFEYGIMNPGDKAKVDGKWKKIRTYNHKTVYFTDGTQAFTDEVEEVSFTEEETG